MYYLDIEIVDSKRLPLNYSNLDIVIKNKNHPLPLLLDKVVINNQEVSRYELFRIQL